MSYLTSLITIRDNYVAKLEAVSGEDKDKVTYSVDGRSFDWVGYTTFLSKAITDTNAQIIAAQGAAEISTNLTG